jgi:hypothetical protein
MVTAEHDSKGAVVGPVRKTRGDEQGQAIFV